MTHKKDKIRTFKTFDSELAILAACAALAFRKDGSGVDPLLAALIAGRGTQTARGSSLSTVGASETCPPLCNLPFFYRVTPARARHVWTASHLRSPRRMTLRFLWSLENPAIRRNGALRGRAFRSSAADAKRRREGELSNNSKPVEREGDCARQPKRRQWKGAIESDPLSFSSDAAGFLLARA